MDTREILFRPEYIGQRDILFVPRGLVPSSSLPATVLNAERVKIETLNAAPLWQGPVP